MKDYYELTVGQIKMVSFHETRTNSRQKSEKKYTLGPYLDLQSVFNDFM